jgi:hypothetical protein
VCVFMCVCPFHIPPPYTILRVGENVRLVFLWGCARVYVYKKKNRFPVTPSGILYADNETCYDSLRLWCVGVCVCVISTI